VIANLIAALAISAPTPASEAVVTTLPDCTINQLSLTFDDENGNFDGMSHSGRLLVLRNYGDHACKTSALPILRFEDAAHRPLALVRRTPLGMHPGPVVIPVGLAPGAEATARMRWVSGNVYDGHHCLTAASVSLQLGTETLTKALHVTICGPMQTSVTYDQEWLRTDSALTP
jgi:hypothetical protein